MDHCPNHSSGPKWGKGLKLPQFYRKPMVYRPSQCQTSPIRFSRMLDFDAQTRLIFAPFDDAPADQPFVVGQIGQSLDGRVATPSGDSCPIGGSAALDHLHRLRAHVDAVLVGAATVRADNPQLTVRRVEGANPARVVVDARLRGDITHINAEPANWLADNGARRILVTANSTKAGPELACDEIIKITPEEGALPPAAIIKQLSTYGFRKILVEGGPATLGRFLQAGCLNRLHVVISPLIIGSGKQAFNLAPINRLAQARRPNTTCYMLGNNEVLFDCNMRSS